MLDSIESGTSVGYQPGTSREDADNAFYHLRGALD